ECSLRPEKFMKMILLQKRIDYIILYRLIIKAFKEIEMIHEIVSDFSSDIGESFPLYEPYSLYYKVPQMLDGDKAIKKCKSYKRSKFILENELEDKRLRARRTWKRIKELLDFYIKIERGTLSFNEKTWRFE
ncbi:MAG: hypothetical protein KAX04_04450, partial [Methanomicrobia archaeon]|nr:hypothetical protein [Methanomicrobia archaeon]